RLTSTRAFASVSEAGTRRDRDSMRNPNLKESEMTKKYMVAGGTLAAALALSGCAGGSEGGDRPEQTDSGGPITVWVDPPRVPAAEAFKEAHPDIDVEVTQIDGTVGGQTVRQAFANFDTAGEGWPDVIFFPTNDDIA